MKKYLVLVVVALVLLFSYYFSTLTWCTIIVCCLIWSISNMGIYVLSKKILLWPVYLILTGMVALLTLHNLYNPGKEVFTNIDHHVLTLTGFQTDTSEIMLLDELNPVSNALWKGEELGGQLAIHSDGKHLFADYKLSQPIYERHGRVDSLLNAENLPFVDGSFTLEFNDGRRMCIAINDQLRPGRVCEWLVNKFKPRSQDTCSVNISFYVKDKMLAASSGGITRIIRRSLPLSEVLKGIPFPPEFDIDLSGITLLRAVAGKEIKDTSLGQFYLAFSPRVLSELHSVKSGDKIYKCQHLLAKGRIPLKEGEAICIGSGIYATPCVRPMLSEGKLELRLDVPLRRHLPVEHDSLDQIQSVVVTSGLRGLAASRTTSALYYPVFTHLPEEQHFNLAIEYLPERTNVPLCCKIQTLGDDTLLFLHRFNNKEATVLAKGDTFLLRNPHRALSPRFTFQDFRECVPFTSRKGYILILLALVMAGISMLAGGERYEVKGEVIVWMGLIILLVYRSFIAWRTSVFPPLDGFSIKGFETYLTDSYTFMGTGCAIVILGVALAGYKLTSRKWTRSIHHPHLLPLISFLILLIGAVGSIWNERLAFIYFPVLGFLVSESIYHYRTKEGEAKEYSWKLCRYISMCLVVVIPLVADAGFGIVFALFMLLYNALDGYFFHHFESLQEMYQGNKKMKVRKGCITLLLAASFCLFLFGGIHIISLLYRHFWMCTLLLGLVVIGLIVYHYQLAIHHHYTALRKHLPVIVVCLLLVIWCTIGKSYFEGHRHLLYRSEVHLKSVDEIMLEQEINSRDLERLFQASQNRWYLGYYMEGRTFSKLNPFDKPYDLRSHFNKGITWQTQKTDAVLGRYIIGEHSMMTVYTLIVLFIVMFVGVFSSVKGNKQLLLIGMGAGLLLVCQALFITLAVTNRFVFFGQDYPLLSQHSVLTLLLTFTLLFVMALSTLRKRNERNTSLEYNRFDKRLVIFLFTLFGCSLIPGRTLEVKSGKNFNVEEALKNATDELKAVNSRLVNFQKEKHDSIAQTGMLASIKHGSTPINTAHYEPKPMQSSYYEFINFFDRQTGMGDTLTALSKRPHSGISPFTASLYRVYRDQISKENHSTNIVYLRAMPDGHVEFNINNKFYLLSTPESDEKNWRGHILPQENIAINSSLILRNDVRSIQLAMKSGGKRIDTDSRLTYDYPMLIAKVDNSWIPDGRDYFIFGKALQEVVIKSGVQQYRLSDASHATHYMVVYSDDYVDTYRNSGGGRTGHIYVKGDQGRYFARNMQVNGRRMMIFPMGEKFFYPYHLSQIASKVLSGDDEKKRKQNLTVSLSYTLTEQLFDDLKSFGVSPAEARSLIVADGNGQIKAMVTTKNISQPSGFVYIDPNDEEQIDKMRNQFYLTGDTKGEERAFGDLNLLYLQPGPGSSIKPLTFTSVISQAGYDWAKLKLYVNMEEQGLRSFVRATKKYIRTNTYAGQSVSLSSLWGDEIGENGYTDIARYMRKSSNYFNSLMVFLGFYEGEFLEKELANATANRFSRLFKGYNKQATGTNFPAFSLSATSSKLYNFRHWVTQDSMPRHENGSLQVGFERNFGLWKEYPYNLFPDQYKESIDFYGDDSLFDMMSLRQKFALAYPSISYLPEAVRITRQGTRNAIRNTTLGADPFHVTPYKMAEMFGRLFSQNRKFRLSLNPHYVQEFEAFECSSRYGERDAKGWYAQALSQNLFKGMSEVPLVNGTASKMADIISQVKKKGYHVYAKTGTIGSEGNDQNTQLLVVVISKNKLEDLNNDEFDQALKDNRFYVMYFLTEKYYHDYQIINRALKTVVNSMDFLRYMNEEKSNTSI